MELPCSNNQAPPHDRPIMHSLLPKCGTPSTVAPVAPSNTLPASTHAPGPIASPQQVQVASRTSATRLHPPEDEACTAPLNVLPMNTIHKAPGGHHRTASPRRPNTTYFPIGRKDDKIRASTEPPPKDVASPTHAEAHSSNQRTPLARHLASQVHAPSPHRRENLAPQVALEALTTPSNPQPTTGPQVTIRVPACSSSLVPRADPWLNIQVPVLGNDSGDDAAWEESHGTAFKSWVNEWRKAKQVIASSASAWCALLEVHVCHTGRLHTSLFVSFGGCSGHLSPCRPPGQYRNMCGARRMSVFSIKHPMPIMPPQMHHMVRWTQQNQR